MYSPGDQQCFPEKTLDIHQTGCKHATITPESFGSKFKKLNKEMFEICDFLGVFKRKAFADCSFNLCDFGMSTWHYVKFSRCTFDRSSFTQTNFINCEFRDCVWRDIGLSGNGTVLLDTTISNPKQFIDAAYTNLDEETLKSFSASAYFQRKELQRSKANVARRLLNTLATKGEEEWYYSAVRTYSVNSFLAAQMENNWRFRQSKGVLNKIRFAFSIGDYLIERWLVNLLGAFNRWGASLTRPLLCGFILILLFGSLYRHFAVFHSWPESLVASLEITVVAGFGKYDAMSKGAFDQFLFVANMIFGVFWFAILVPSLVNRVSRVRG